jgi:peroxiredoxin
VRASPPPATLYNEPAEVVKVNLAELRFVGMDEGPVPDFRLRTVDGKMFDSAALVGHKAFVVVFFATWCPVCELKLPLLRAALDAVGPLTVIGIAVDEPETFPKVEAYVKRFGLRFPIVRASEHPVFNMSYNPFSTVPLVVVVGQNGGLVDYQMGYTPTDRERLIAALKLARVIGPLRSDGERHN